MALNMASFRTRALTAVVFVLVMAAGMLWSGWGFLLLVSVIHFGCWIEYQKLLSKIDAGYQNISGFHRYLVMLAGWLIVLSATHREIGPWRMGDWMLSELAWWPMWLLLVLVFAEPVFNKKLKWKNLAHSIMGLVYISLTLAAFVNIAPTVVNAWAETWFQSWMWFMPAIVIATMWVNDTMAYIVGSLIGKRQLSPISPKKTWEGTIGGIILAAVIVGLLLNTKVENAVVAFLVPLLMAIAGTVGDLFESKLKRLAGVKDSGSIMPGHGGFLDRFDSLLFAAPAAWIILTVYDAISNY
ncbi:MAG TPA: phosphatidate cytidylyltransferase [Chitinophagaceae bacterium]|nr:phosphatidate cytidylyltransferase [Chitinophagaceae bacterium]